MDHPEDYVKRILKALIYIEDHIEEEISIEALAKVSCHSPFHFHRIFKMVVGENVYKYVRRLRLEKAASKLRYTKHPITDIAMDTQYDTPSAFTRAFKQASGHSPRNYRILYKEVNALNKKISELPKILPDKIEKTEELDLLFIRKLGVYSESSFQAWMNMKVFIHENHLDTATIRYFGITHDDPNVTPEDKVRYDACILAPKNIQPQGNVGRQILKSGKCAIFTHHGSYDGIDETYNRIFFKWLPNSKYIVDETRPRFAEYFNTNFL
ncbi:MAG: AraC family transcriptional regulator [Parachlamydiaceae bacterium]|nr:AraC family transcriptional regulator [Parachlamydiaceae bacterium]